MSSWYDFDIEVSRSLPDYSDKVVLPQEVLSEILNRFPDGNLPHPLLFKISDEDELNSTCVGVHEFSSTRSNLCMIPELVSERLNNPLKVAISLQESIPKATFLKLKPLQFYSEQNLKYFLENKLNTYYTVLIKGDNLVIIDKSKRYEFLVENLSHEVACIIDTDVELDIVPLDDEMATQQLQFTRKLNSFENIIDIDLEAEVNNVKPFLQDQYVPTIFKLDVSNRQKKFYISLIDKDIHDLNHAINIDLLVAMDKLVSLDNFRWTTMGQDFDVQYRLEHDSTDTRKIIEIDPYDNEVMRKKGIESGPDNEIDNKYIYMTVFSWNKEANVGIQILDEMPEVHKSSGTDQCNSKQCTNCGKYIDKGNLALHEAFCFRNNVKCSCGEVFLKAIPSTHWHCDSCKDKHGDSETLRFKHYKLIHGQYKCNQCFLEKEFKNFTDMVVNHKATGCPGKLHECRFCHLIVPQEEATYKDLYDGLTHHENACGNKTTECYKCGKLVRSKDLATHLKHHELDKVQFNRLNKILFNKCRNQNCVNLVNGTSNHLQLCDICFGPLYSSQLDPHNVKLQSRIERRYMLQLTKGCGNSWCHNKYCHTGNRYAPEFDKKLIKDILSLITDKLFLFISTPALPLNANRTTHPNTLWFCVNESILNKSNIASVIMSEGQYEDEMIYKAVNENSSEDQVRGWLRNNAITA